MDMWGRFKFVMWLMEIGSLILEAYQFEVGLAGWDKDGQRLV